MRRIIASLGLITGASLVIVGGFTGAFFSDTETSTGNVFAAGAIDLKVDNESYYNGNRCTNVGTQENPDWQWQGNNPYPVPDTPCDTSWDLSDLSLGHLFFNFLDLKPGDYGEDTISLHVQNEAWACMDITLTSNDENDLTEPEATDGDDTSGENGGELAQNIQMLWWADDGDNVFEGDENILATDLLSALEIDVPREITLADSTTNAWGFGAGTPLPVGTSYIAKAWCLGTLTLAPVVQGQGDPQTNPGFSCDGTLLDNKTQTDSATLDIQFRAVQARHNAGFLCKPGNGGVACEEKADVMLVLDRSGSISPGELTTLKTAATSFVDAMAPALGGVHMGQVSFASTASLDLELTHDTVSIKNAINALTSGGNTNLSAAIDLAVAELGSVRDKTPDSGVGASPDYIVIISDGAPNAGGGEAGATASADAAKAAGITIYVVGVGVGSTAAEDFLKSIATSDEHYFSADDFDDLAEELAKIATCPNGNGGGQFPKAEALTNFPQDFGIGATTGTFPAPWEKHETATVMQNPSGSGEDIASPNGGRFAKIAEDSGDSGTVDGWICRSVNATTFNTLVLSYFWRGDSDAEVSDTGLVQHKPAGGGAACSDTAGWTNAASHVLSPQNPWAASSIPLGALDGTTFLLRFYNDSSATDEFFRVDAVTVTGVPN